MDVYLNTFVATRGRQKHSTTFYNSVSLGELFFFLKLRANSLHFSCSRFGSFALGCDYIDIKLIFMPLLLYDAEVGLMKGENNSNLVVKYLTHMLFFVGLFPAQMSSRVRTPAGDPR